MLKWRFRSKRLCRLGACDLYSNRKGIVQMKKLMRILIVTVTVSLCVGAIVEVQAKSDAVGKGVKAYCIDFNWGEGGPNAFARPGLWADADPKEHVAWYKSLGANVIQTFAVSCNGYAWYKNGVVPEQPGLKHDFLAEMVRLGHKENMKVMGYFCVASNTRWGQLNPGESYGVPADGHIPLTKEYNKFFTDSVKDALKKTGMDGFMIDWLFHGPIRNTKIKWLDCEIEMWGELMDGAFPGKSKVTKAQELEFARRSVDRCWQSIRRAAKSVKPDCIIWLSLYKLKHPQVVNSRVIKEVDWLMNEGGTVEELGKIRKELGRGNLINCLAAWNKADPREVVPASIEAGFGLYGFTKPVKGSLLPSIDDYYLAKDIDDLAGDEANVAMLARAYRGITSGSVSLFNGRDLSGWHVDVPKMDKNPDVKSPFIVRDGMLVSLGSPGGHIITDAEYSNYRLEVEYRFAGKPGNCGVLVHASTPRSLYRMFPKSVEVQMMHKNAGDFWCIVEDITVPDMVARRGPKEKWGIVEGKSRRIKNLTDDSEKPAGEWNRMVIECVGDSVKVWVNGDVVNHGTGCTASKGQIALQAEGSEVEFRKVLLTPVKKSGGGNR